MSDGWISVEDRLPKCEQTVIVSDQTDGVWVGFMDDEGSWVWADGLTPRNITHWMPLPEPPKSALAKARGEA